MILKSRVTILVKASPQPSKKHNETVCCAGLDENGKWKRLFPIRFRQLSGNKAFNRWDTVSFEYRKLRDDNRIESCRVHEESLQISGKVLKDTEKSSIVTRALVGSEKEAIAMGHSLAINRPQNIKFSWKRRTENQLNAAKEAFEAQAAQLSLLDNELKAYLPCPFVFSMHYSDEGGQHNKTCADWETEAAFFNLSRDREETAVLEHLSKTYCDIYPQKGLVFALGNMKKRPQTWQLLGIFPAKKSNQRMFNL